MMRYGRRDVVKLLAASGAVAGGFDKVLAGTGGVTVKDRAVSPGLPEGYRRPGNMKWGWGPESDGILPNWSGGSGTRFDAEFVDWNIDGSATLLFDRVDGAWVGGELQVTHPRRSIQEGWGAVISSQRPTAVCAFFAYAADGTEIDFEWRGDQVWQMNLHLFAASGKRINPSPLPTFKTDITAPHRYEFSLSETACIWRVDGHEVARISPADMPGALWKSSSDFEMFCSVEHHGAWAKHAYLDLPASMSVHGLLV